MMSNQYHSFQALAEHLVGESVVAVNFQFFRKPPGGLPTPPHQVACFNSVSDGIKEDLPYFFCFFLHGRSTESHILTNRNRNKQTQNSGWVLLHVGATWESHHSLVGTRQGLFCCFRQGCFFVALDNFVCSRQGFLLLLL